MTNDVIEALVKRLPHKPGVYLMKDVSKTIMYVGKALDLSNRVRSYFQNPARLTPKTQRMVSRIADIDYFIAASEEEALILELNLIKQHRPHYNVRLKDDKSFPYIKVDVTDEWPRVYLTRRFEQDGGRYFGPFSSAWSVKQTLKVLKNIFPYRQCSKVINGKAPRPCLEFHMGRCLGPCSGEADKAEYDEIIREVTLFLEGKREPVLKDLKARMSRAAADMQYEKAAQLRDQIQAIENVIQGERIAATIRGDEDVIAFVRDNDHAYVQMLVVRNNKMVGREGFLLRGTSEEDPKAVMSGFIKQFYSSAMQIPPLLLLQYPVEERQVLQEWLKGRRGSAVKIEVPRRGVKKQLVDMAAENARQGLERIKIKDMASSLRTEDGMAELQEVLGMSGPPARMEAYDISNIQGTSAVGSMVVFEDGKPRNAHYRRFKIKTVEGANDYAMLQEVLQRRFKRVSSGDAGETWAIRPDLVLIDGGKGQLNSVTEALGDIDGVTFIGLAKENEEIFLPGRKLPIVLPRTSPGLQMLQRIRDEAHRFAVSYHSNVHRQKTFKSSLDGIPGIGPRRKSALLRRFGSVSGIREATIDEIMAATGMSRIQAEKVKEQL